MNALSLGLFIFLGLTALGFQLADSALQIKQYERTVSVKGLSEREYPADRVIWPIHFSVASNDLESLYRLIEQHNKQIHAFLKTKGVDESEISLSFPSVVDKSARQYGNSKKPMFRFIANQSITVYSTHVDSIRTIKNDLSELGKTGIVFSGNEYENQMQYLFTRLNEIKPEMIEEATKNARVVAEKFATDSNSVLGKIKTARQGQFSISNRDKNNPHIKKVRVVSTIEYYLSD